MTYSHRTYRCYTVTAAVTPTGRLYTVCDPKGRYLGRTTDPALAAAMVDRDADRKGPRAARQR